MLRHHPGKDPGKDPDGGKTALASNGDTALLIEKHHVDQLDHYQSNACMKGNITEVLNATSGEIPPPSDKFQTLDYYEIVDAGPEWRAETEETRAHYTKQEAAQSAINLGLGETELHTSFTAKYCMAECCFDFSEVHGESYSLEKDLGLAQGANLSKHELALMISRRVYMHTVAAREGTLLKISCESLRENIMRMKAFLRDEDVACIGKLTHLEHGAAKQHSPDQIFALKRMSVTQKGILVHGAMLLDGEGVISGQFQGDIGTSFQFTGNYTNVHRLERSILNEVSEGVQHTAVSYIAAQEQLRVSTLKLRSLAKIRRILETRILRIEAVLNVFQPAEAVKMQNLAPTRSSSQFGKAPEYNPGWEASFKRIVAKDEENIGEGYSSISSGDFVSTRSDLLSCCIQIKAASPMDVAMNGLGKSELMDLAYSQVLESRVECSYCKDYMCLMLAAETKDWDLYDRTNRFLSGEKTLVATLIRSIDSTDVPEWAKNLHYKSTRPDSVVKTDSFIYEDQHNFVESVGTHYNMHLDECCSSGTVPLDPKTFFQEMTGQGYSEDPINLAIVAGKKQKAAKNKFAYALSSLGNADSLSKLPFYAVMSGMLPFASAEQSEMKDELVPVLAYFLMGLLVVLTVSEVMAQGAKVLWKIHYFKTIQYENKVNQNAKIVADSNAYKIQKKWKKRKFEKMFKAASEANFTDCKETWDFIEYNYGLEQDTIAGFQCQVKLCQDDLKCKNDLGIVTAKACDEKIPDPPGMSGMSGDDVLTPLATWGTPYEINELMATDTLSKPGNTHMIDDRKYRTFGRLIERNNSAIVIQNAWRTSNKSANAEDKAQNNRRSVVTSKGKLSDMKSVMYPILITSLMDCVSAMPTEGGAQSAAFGMGTVVACVVLNDLAKRCNFDTIGSHLSAFGKLEEKEEPPKKKIKECKDDEPPAMAAMREGLLSVGFTEEQLEGKSLEDLQTMTERISAYEFPPNRLDINYEGKAKPIEMKKEFPGPEPLQMNLLKPLAIVPAYPAQDPEALEVLKEVSKPRVLLPVMEDIIICPPKSKPGKVARGGDLGCDDPWLLGGTNIKSQTVQRFKHPDSGCDGLLKNEVLKDSTYSLIIKPRPTVTAFEPASYIQQVEVRKDKEEGVYKFRIDVELKGNFKVDACLHHDQSGARSVWFRVKAKPDKEVESNRVRKRSKRTSICTSMTKANFYSLALISCVMSASLDSAQADNHQDLGYGTALVYMLGTFLNFFAGQDMYENFWGIDTQLYPEGWTLWFGLVVWVMMGVNLAYSLFSERSTAYEVATKWNAMIQIFFWMIVNTLLMFTLEETWGENEGGGNSAGTGWSWVLWVLPVTHFLLTVQIAMMLSSLNNSSGDLGPGRMDDLLGMSGFKMALIFEALATCWFLHSLMHAKGWWRCNQVNQEALYCGPCTPSFRESCCCAEDDCISEYYVGEEGSWWNCEAVPGVVLTLFVFYAIVVAVGLHGIYPTAATAWALISIGLNGNTNSNPFMEWYPFLLAVPFVAWMAYWVFDVIMDEPEKDVTMLPEDMNDAVRKIKQKRGLLPMRGARGMTMMMPALLAVSFMENGEACSVATGVGPSAIVALAISGNYFADANPTKFSDMTASPTTGACILGTWSSNVNIERHSGKCLDQFIYTPSPIHCLHDEPLEVGILEFVPWNIANKGPMTVEELLSFEWEQAGMADTDATARMSCVPGGTDDNQLFRLTERVCNAACSGNALITDSNNAQLSSSESVLFSSENCGKKTTVDDLDHDVLMVAPGWEDFPECHECYGKETCLDHAQDPTCSDCVTKNPDGQGGSTASQVLGYLPPTVVVPLTQNLNPGGRGYTQETAKRPCHHLKSTIPASTYTMNHNECVGDRRWAPETPNSTIVGRVGCRGGIIDSSSLDDLSSSGAYYAGFHSGCLGIKSRLDCEMFPQCDWGPVDCSDAQTEGVCSTLNGGKTDSDSAYADCSWGKNKQSKSSERGGCKTRRSAKSTSDAPGNEECRGLTYEMCEGAQSVSNCIWDPSIMPFVMAHANDASDLSFSVSANQKWGCDVGNTVYHNYKDAIGENQKLEFSGLNCQMVPVPVGLTCRVEDQGNGDFEGYNSHVEQEEMLRGSISPSLEKVSASDLSNPQPVTERCVGHLGSDEECGGAGGCDNSLDNFAASESLQGPKCLSTTSQYCSCSLEKKIRSYKPDTSKVRVKEDGTLMNEKEITYVVFANPKAHPKGMCMPTVKVSIGLSLIRLGVEDGDRTCSFGVDVKCAGREMGDQRKSSVDFSIELSKMRETSEMSCVLAITVGDSPVNFRDVDRGGITVTSKAFTLLAKEKCDWEWNWSYQSIMDGGSYLYDCTDAQEKYGILSYLLIGVMLLVVGGVVTRMVTNIGMFASFMVKGGTRGASVAGRGFGCCFGLCCHEDTRDVLMSSMTKDGAGGWTRIPGSIKRAVKMLYNGHDFRQDDPLKNAVIKRKARRQASRKTLPVRMMTVLFGFTIVSEGTAARTCQCVSGCEQWLNKDPCGEKVSTSSQDAVCETTGVEELTFQCTGVQDRSLQKFTLTDALEVTSQSRVENRWNLGVSSIYPNGASALVTTNLYHEGKVDLNKIWYLTSGAVTVADAFQSDTGCNLLTLIEASSYNQAWVNSAVTASMNQVKCSTLTDGACTRNEVYDMAGGFIHNTGMVCEHGGQYLLQGRKFVGHDSWTYDFGIEDRYTVTEVETIVTFKGRVVARRVDILKEQSAEKVEIILNNAHHGVDATISMELETLGFPEVDAALDDSKLLCLKEVPTCENIKEIEGVTSDVIESVCKKPPNMAEAWACEACMKDSHWADRLKDGGICIASPGSANLDCSLGSKAACGTLPGCMWTTSQSASGDPVFNEEICDKCRRFHDDAPVCSGKDVWVNSQCVVTDPETSADQCTHLCTRGCVGNTKDPVRDAKCVSMNSTMCALDMHCDWYGSEHWEDAEGCPGWTYDSNGAVKIPEGQEGANTCVWREGNDYPCVGIMAPQGQQCLYTGHCDSVVAATPARCYNDQGVYFDFDDTVGLKFTSTTVGLSSEDWDLIKPGGDFGREACEYIIEHGFIAAATEFPPDWHFVKAEEAMDAEAACAASGDGCWHGKSHIHGECSVKTPTDYQGGCIDDPNFKAVGNNPCENGYSSAVSAAGLEVGKGNSSFCSSDYPGAHCLFVDPPSGSLQDPSCSENDVHTNAITHDSANACLAVTNWANVADVCVYQEHSMSLTTKPSNMTMAEWDAQSTCNAPECGLHTEDAIGCTQTSSSCLYVAPSVGKDCEREFERETCRYEHESQCISNKCTWAEVVMGECYDIGVKNGTHCSEMTDAITCNAEDSEGDVVCAWSDYDEDCMNVRPAKSEICEPMCTQGLNSSIVCSTQYTSAGCQEANCIWGAAGNIGQLAVTEENCPVNSDGHHCPCGPGLMEGQCGSFCKERAEVPAKCVTEWAEEVDCRGTPMEECDSQCEILEGCLGGDLPACGPKIGSDATVDHCSLQFNTTSHCTGDCVLGTCNDIMSKSGSCPDPCKGKAADFESVTNAGLSASGFTMCLLVGGSFENEGVNSQIEEMFPISCETPEQVGEFNQYDLYMQSMAAEDAHDQKGGSITTADGRLLKWDDLTCMFQRDTVFSEHNTMDGTVLSSFEFWKQIEGTKPNGPKLTYEEMEIMDFLGAFHKHDVNKSNCMEDCGGKKDSAGIGIEDCYLCEILDACKVDSDLVWNANSCLYQSMARHPKYPDPPPGHKGICDTGSLITDGADRNTRCELRPCSKVMMPHGADVGSRFEDTSFSKTTKATLEPSAEKCGVPAAEWVTRECANTAVDFENTGVLLQVKNVPGEYWDGTSGSKVGMQGIQTTSVLADVADKPAYTTVITYGVTGLRLNVIKQQARGLSWGDIEPANNTCTKGHMDIAVEVEVKVDHEGTGGEFSISVENRKGESISEEESHTIGGRSGLYRIELNKPTDYVCCDLHELSTGKEFRKCQEVNLGTRCNSFGPTRWEKNGHETHNGGATKKWTPKPCYNDTDIGRNPLNIPMCKKHDASKPKPHEHSNGIENWFDNAWKSVKDAAKAVVGVIGEGLKSLWNAGSGFWHYLIDFGEILIAILIVILSVMGLGCVYDALSSICCCKRIHTGMRKGKSGYGHALNSYTPMTPQLQSLVEMGVKKNDDEPELPGDKMEMSHMGDWQNWGKSKLRNGILSKNPIKEYGVHGSSMLHQVWLYLRCHAGIIGAGVTALVTWIAIPDQVSLMTFGGILIWAFALTLLGDLHFFSASNKPSRSGRGKRKQMFSWGGIDSGTPNKMPNLGAIVKFFAGLLQVAYRYVYTLPVYFIVCLMMLDAFLGYVLMIVDPKDMRVGGDMMRKMIRGGVHSAGAPKDRNELIRQTVGWFLIISIGISDAIEDCSALKGDECAWCGHDCVDGDPNCID